MSDRPKPTGEWTHEKLQGLLQISNEDRYVADHAFENTLDAINAALAAERDKNWRNAYDNLLIDYTQLREQLAAERGKVEVAENIARGTQVELDGADKVIAKGWLAAEREKVKTLVDALTDLREAVDGIVNPEVTKVTTDNTLDLINASRKADVVIAKVKEEK